MVNASFFLLNLFLFFLIFKLSSEILYFDISLLGVAYVQVKTDLSIEQ